MSQVQSFINQNNGRYLDWDGSYGAQCVDEARYWLKHIGVPQVPPPANAVEWWTKSSDGDWLKTANTSTNYPPRGALIIWNGNVGGGAGHIALVTASNVNTFNAFSQNWPVGSPCKEVTFNYKNVVGWIFPKKLIPAPPPPEPTPTPPIPTPEPIPVPPIPTPIPTPVPEPPLPPPIEPPVPPTQPTLGEIIVEFLKIIWEAIKNWGKKGIR